MATRKAKKKPLKKVKKSKKPVGRKTRVKKKSAAKGKKRKSAAIGVVTHYFPNVKAAVVMLKNPLVVGEEVKFQGHTTNFSQKVTSMQINHRPLQRAKKGDEIGLEVNERVREHDLLLPAEERLASQSVNRPSVG